MRIPKAFPIDIYDYSENAISETISKARLRIFYKGKNRNGGYITDDFAEYLLGTLPYAPVKGIYDENEEDFTDHGTERTEGRIYGIVPAKEAADIRWEKHTDDDGVEREYACCNVYLYTALYEEARKIPGKGHSMELFKPSIEGEWVFVGDEELYKYSKASFLGLQALGDKATPCFQGSAFYTLESNSLFTTLDSLFKEVNQLGEKIMENSQVSFTLSDNQKGNKLQKTLNDGKYRYYVFDTYADYGIVFDYETEKYLKVNFSIDESDSIVVQDGDFEELFAEFVTGEEKAALDTLRNKTEQQTYVSVVTTIEEQENNIATLQNNFDVEVEKNTTLMTEKSTLENTISEQNTVIETYKQENEQLKQFKNSLENQEKDAIIAKYSCKLSAEVIEKYTAEKENYSSRDLEKELSYEFCHANEGLFTTESTPGYVPAETPLDGISALIQKHCK